MTPSLQDYSASLVPAPGAVEEPISGGAGGWHRWWWRYRSSPVTLFGLAVVAVLLLAGLLAPWITAYPADAGSTTNFAATLLAPSGAHPFGTDDVGRDILTRVVFGARISL